MRKKINNYSFDEIEVGLVEQFEEKITKDMLSSFEKITGDINPLHTDVDYAKLNGFPDLVVYGMLSASFFSKLAGVYIPGKKSLIHNVNINFHKPVFIGDRLTVSGEVKEKDDRFNLIKLKLKVLNQNSLRVISGSMQIGLLTKD